MRFCIFAFTAATAEKANVSFRAACLFCPHAFLSVRRTIKNTEKNLPDNVLCPLTRLYRKTAGHKPRRRHPDDNVPGKDTPLKSDFQKNQPFSFETPRTDGLFCGFSSDRHSSSSIHTKQPSRHFCKSASQT